VGEKEPLPNLLAQLRSTFALDAAAILVREDADIGTAWRLEAAVGAPIPECPDDGDSIAIDPSTSLVLVGPTLGADDRRLLSAFAAQLGAALAGRVLQAEASQAALLTQANNLRSAMLQSVSHDLRTPLASIKASVTSLLQSDVSFSVEDQLDLLVTIDEESDRLNRVVANLLDMSRLQANALECSPIATEVDDVVAGALASIDAPADRLIVDVDATLPAVWADPGLLERALANLVANALVWSPSHEPVRVRATAHGGHVAISIADRGPGIPKDQLARVFEPFQRLGDRSSQAGVGLGLAVARGFVRAMGGELELDDTPGGGLSAIISLPVVAP
jgi:two-component system, OmpR family, sensor histidine kinase KdpD